MMRIIISALIILLSYYYCEGQKREFQYQAEIGGMPSNKRLPFWLYSNNFGKIAPDAYLYGNAGIYSDFKKKNTRSFDIAFGFEGTGYLGKDENNIFVNQLYGRMRWQNLVLDLGMINRPIEYDGLSSTNGDMLYSTNSRSLPGICLATYDFIKFPWIGKWFSFRAKYAEYTMIDDRFMGDRTRLHNKLLGIRITPIPQISIEGGIEHYAQWGGENSLVGGKQPHSLKDYVRIVAIKGGGSDASEGEQINKIGNHIGMHFLKIGFQAQKWEAKFYYNHMFEDGSGMKFRNTPDGLYGIYLNRKHNHKWFKSFLYELYYTKDQSGPYHNDPITGEVVGGNDDYFNNYVYRSGWTFYGRMIGSPFFTTSPKNENGWTLGTFNNRFIAHHFGLSGELPFNIKYKLLFSYSLNYGSHSSPFYNETGYQISKSQYSFGAEFTAPECKLPFNTAINIGFDKGDLLQNNFGIMLKLFKTGLF